MHLQIKMDIFAKIKLIVRYRKVAYYSISIVDDEKEDPSLFEQFLDKHTKANQRKLSHILSWIALIGEKYGAKEQFYREEREASALPPKGKDRQPAFIEYGKATPNNLRLYCFRLSEEVVFLFDGDIKTTNAAQDCPNVRRHFNLANRITQAIDQSIVEKEIEWNKDCTDIMYDTEFTLTIKS